MALEAQALGVFFCFLKSGPGLMATKPTEGSLSETESTVRQRFCELQDRLAETHPHDDFSLLQSSFAFALKQHGAQQRKSGDLYMSHPIEVAHLLAEMELDLVCIITGLLHDLVEDTNVSIALIRKHFGQEIARCVQGVTKLSKLDYCSAEEHQAESFRKMLLAMVDDIRVILVKLADRLHNMRTLKHLDRGKQQLVARETLEIYAPIALRLGMGKMRGELEDLALSFLEPNSYKEITTSLDQDFSKNENFLSQTKKSLANALETAQVPVVLESRIKRTYSIYRKLQNQQTTMDQVYDLLALRVITDSETNCYAALGVVHSLWRPVPGRIKDFIAMPRSNLYRSLHTSVIDKQGHTFEVQIRTEEMHQMAEKGICAHWKYKEGLTETGSEDSRMAWLRQLVAWQRDIQDPNDFLSTLKIDLYPEEVYVFTPQGTLIVLPRAATPIDFAYAIHTEVGHSCVGAKANGRIVQLNYHLRNGDIIEVLTKTGHTPNRNWLSSVNTSRARNKIKRWLNIQQRAKAEQIGFKLLEKEARRQNISLSTVDDKVFAVLCRKYACRKPADLYAALGYGKHSSRKVIAELFLQLGRPAPKMLPPPTSSIKRNASTSDTPVLNVKGVDDIMVFRARCCNPIAGESIIGYVTRGRGVSVHASTCSYVQSLMYESDRRMDVQWSNEASVAYRTHLLIRLQDRPGILADLSNVISEEKVNISSVETHRRKRKDGLAAVEMILEVTNIAQLNNVITGVKKISGVRHVRRRRRV